MSPYLLTFRLVVNEAKWHCFLVKMSLICMTMNIMFISIILQNAFMQQEVFRTLYLWYRSNIFCSFICSFLPPHCKLLKHLLSVQCVQCTNVFIFLVIYFFIILVPRLSGKEQLLFSFVKMAEPESIGGGTDTDHHDNKLVKVGFHTIYRIVKC